MTPRVARGALLAVNLVIAFAALLRSWGYYEVLLIFWAEALVIGVFTVARMVVVAMLGKPLGDWIDASAPLSRLFLLVVGVGFFVVKYGGFAIAMGLLVIMVPAFLHEGQGSEVWRALGAIGPTAVYAMAALALSHGISFIANFVAGREYERTNLALLLIAPYLRMWLVMVALALGLVAAALLPAYAATGAFGATVVLFKLLADVLMHDREHA